MLILPVLSRESIAIAEKDETMPHHPEVTWFSNRALSCSVSSEAAGSRAAAAAAFRAETSNTMIFHRTQACRDIPV